MSFESTTPVKAWVSIGYLRAIEEAGIARDDSLIKIGNFKKESGKSLTRELLEQSNRPEAIFTTNIDMSMGALLAIKELGKILSPMTLASFVSTIRTGP